MNRDRLFLTVLLALLLLVKGWAPFQDHGFHLAVVPGALMFVGIFGSPQLFWLVQLPKIVNGNQSKIVFLVVVFFVIAYAFFGFFPGQSRPSWGSSAHFEVPIAFGVEWVIAIILFMPFWLLGRNAKTHT